jgi:hypothetical protein
LIPDLIRRGSRAAQHTTNHNMTKYSPLPQLDLEMRTTSGKAIQSITISKDKRPDGSIVRRKETLLAGGTIIVDERVVSSGRDSIRWVPTTFETPAVTILPLHHKSLSQSKDHRSSCFRTACACTAIVLLIIFLVQLLLWYLLKSGRGAVNLKDLVDFIHN